MTGHQPLLVPLFSEMLQAFDEICHDKARLKHWTSHLAVPNAVQGLLGHPKTKGKQPKRLSVCTAPLFWPSIKATSMIIFLTS